MSRCRWTGVVVLTVFVAHASRAQESGGGIQVRAMVVAAETDEQQPRFESAKPQGGVERPEELTLLVELKNVGARPLSLLGTRYGGLGRPTLAGKSSADTFAPLLFDYEFYDQAGKLVELPRRRRLDTDAMLELSDGKVETVEPGKSLVVLVRPLKGQESAALALKPGEYQVRVRYHGPSPGAIKELKRVWPERAVADAWSGTADAAKVSFRIAGDPTTPELAWGEAVDGLRAAVELRSSNPSARVDTANATFPHGSLAQVRFHVKNVSDRPISFVSERWRQGDRVTIVDQAGTASEPRGSWYSGWAILDPWTLKPGQVAVLTSIPLGIAAGSAEAGKIDHPVGPVLIGKPGPYRLRYELRFGDISRKDGNGNQTVPAPGYRRGTLATGFVPLTVRERVPEDDPPTFTARLQFRSPAGVPVTSGQVDVRIRNRPEAVRKGELSRGPYEIPDCPPEALTVYVRAAGFEETRFDAVKPRPNEVTLLTLKPAEATRFRLVGPDGRPVAGAKVRYFNRSAAKASAGPYPSYGTDGPVWSTSDATGAVVLDTLQKSDADYPDLGNSIYHFYVEPEGLAPRFVGPVEAGADLGDLRLGPFLEVRGEIRGTPAELAAFAAEWDQPEPMLRGDGKVGWHYAVSKRLETKRVGDRLSFHLTDLRPGPFRIVSRFAAGGAPVRHVYTRRDPTPDDVVFEVQLTESRNDVLVKNR